MSRTESDIAAACDALARSLGWAVESYSDARQVRTAPGLPDRRYVRAARRVWVECKAPGGKLTPEQHRFLVSELDAGAHATVIDDDAQLLRLFRDLATMGGRGAALDYCRALVDQTAARGYRGMAKGAA